MKQINFYETDINQDDINAVTEVLKSGWITTGPKTKEFENKISEFCKTNKTVCLNSATACLTTVLRILGIGEGDEVITTSFTYTASVSPIYHVGATPIIIDTQPNSAEMDYEKIASAITEKTKAIIAVDIGGCMCDYDELFKISHEKQSNFTPSSDIQQTIGRIAIIADAAHSFGSYYKEKISGSIADFTCFSFHAVKNLTTAEGGAFTWKSFGIDDEIYNKAMLLSLHGQSRDAFNKTLSGGWEYDVVEPYYKCNMTDISASLGISQLSRYDQTLKIRESLVNRYMEKLNSDKIQIVTKNSATSLYNGHLFLIRLCGKNRKFRDEFIENMTNINMNVHFKPIPMLSAYEKRGILPSNYPNACDFFQNLVSLPLHNNLSFDDIDYICNEILNYLEQNND